MAKIGRIGTRLEFEGNKEYVAATKEINKSLKMLGSEMKAVTYEFGRGDKSIEGLTKRKGLLEQQFNEQAKAADAARDALEKMREAGVEPSNEAFQDMERVLRENESTMAGTKRQIGEIDDQLSTSEKAKREFAESSEKITKNLSLLGAEMGLVTAEYAKNADGVEALSKKKELLERRLDENAKTVEAAEKALTAMREGGVDPASDAYMDMEKALLIGKTALVQTQNEIDGITEKLSTSEQAKREFSESSEKITKTLDLLGAEMGLLNAEYAKNSDNVEALSGKKELLAKQLDENAKTVEAAEKALTAMREDGIDPASDAYMDMEKALLSSKTALVQTQNEIAEIDEQLQESKATWENAGDVFVGVMKGLGVAMAAVGVKAAAAGKYIYGMAMDAATAGNSVNDMAVKMGMSRDAIQEWDYILSQNGASLYNLNYGMRRLQGAMGDVRDDGGKVGQAISRLGLDFDEVRQKSPEDAMNAIVTAFQGMEEGAEKTALALQIFGQRGGMDLVPLLNNTTEEMEGLRQAAHDLGMVMSEDAIDAAVGFSNSMDTLQRSFGGIKNSIGIELLPGFEMITDGLTGLINGCAEAGDLITAGVHEVVNGITDAIPRVLELFNHVAQTVAEIAPKVITALVDGIVGNIPLLIDAALDIVMSLVEGIILALPALLDGAIQIIAGLAQGITAALPTLIPVLIDVITQMTQTLMDNIPMLVDAGLQLIMGLAIGLIDAIPAIIDAIPNIVNAIITAILESIPLLINAGIDLLVALVEALPEIITAIVEAIPQIIDGIITALMESLPIIIQAGIDLFIALIEALPEIIVTIVQAIPQIIMAIVNAIVDNIDQIIMGGVMLFMALIQNLPTIIIEIAKAVPQIVTGIVGAFLELIPELLGAGWNLMMGLKQGILNAAGAVVDAVRDVGGRILGGIRSFFGINSPSTVFAEIGGNLAEGISVGFDREASDVEKKMTGAMGKAGEMTAQEAVRSVGEGIISNISKLDYAVSAVVERIVNGLTAETETLIAHGKDIIIQIATGMEMGISEITAVVPQITHAIIIAITSEQKQFHTAGAEFNRQIAAGKVSAISEITGKVPQIVQAVITAYTATHQQFRTAGMELNRQIAAGKISAISEITGKVPQIVQAVITAYTATHQQFRAAGVELNRQIATGKVSGIPEITSKVPQITQAIIIAYTAEHASFRNVGIDLNRQIAAGKVSGIPEIISKVPQIIHAILSTMEGFHSQFVAIGENMTRGIWQGFQNMRGWLENNVRNMMRAIVSAVQQEMRINSPSLVFAEIGEQMAAGLGVGFVKEIRDVRREIEKATQSIAPKPPRGSPSNLRQPGGAISGGGFNFVQNIYTQETNYAAQQREAAKKFKQIAREVGA